MSNTSLEKPFKSPSTIETITLILRILFKSVPFTKANRARLELNENKDGFKIPAINFHGPFTLTEDDIHRFNIAVRQTVIGNNNDRINPFFFVSLCQPIIMMTIASENCPFRPVGSVNTSNRLEFIDAVMCRDPKAILKASLDGDLTYTSRFGGDELQGQRKRRGIECQIEITIKHRERIIFTLHAFFLQFLPKNHPPSFVEEGEGKSKDTKTKERLLPVMEMKQDLSMNTKHPHQWAASCSDYNPIHISSLAARMLGFSSTIAHGNHVAALAIQGVISDSTLLSSFSDATSSDGIIKPDEVILSPGFSMQIDFVKPVLLPADLRVVWKSNKRQHQVDFEIINAKDQTCIVGLLKL